MVGKCDDAVDCRMPPEQRLNAFVQHEVGRRTGEISFYGIQQRGSQHGIPHLAKADNQKPFRSLISHSQYISESRCNKVSTFQAKRPPEWEKNAYLRKRKEHHNQIKAEDTLQGDNTMQPFVHLHVHSQYSILDGQASINALVDKAMADGMPAIALTDHGNMFGIKEFFNYVSKEKFQDERCNQGRERRSRRGRKRRRHSPGL